MVTRLIIITVFFAIILVIFNILVAFMLQTSDLGEENDAAQSTGWKMHSSQKNTLRKTGTLETNQTPIVPTSHPSNTEIFSNESRFVFESNNYERGDSQSHERRKVVLIHVGKTGGETVRHTLKVTCQMRRNPVEQQACRDSFKAKPTGSKNQSATVESLLSKHTIGTLHCGSLIPKHSLDQATTLLWTIRNPLDRVVSWFRYMNPANCRPDEDYHSTACNTNRTIENQHRKKRHDKKAKGSQWSFKFFTCFSTINQFASALAAPSMQPGTANTKIEQEGKIPLKSTLDCTQLAWRTILAEGSSSSGHVYFNYKHYWEATIAKHPNLEVWVLRTEQLWEDMLQLEHILLQDQHRISSPLDFQYKFTERRNVTHGSEGHVHRQQPTAESHQKLCLALKDEITIYRNLLARATNLREVDKFDSLKILADQCGGFQDWLWRS